MVTEKPKLHPQIAEQLKDWNRTLDERFMALLERLSAEVAAGDTYRSAPKVLAEISHFVGRVRSDDILARSDAAGYRTLVTDLDNALKKLKLDEPPQRASA